MVEVFKTNVQEVGESIRLVHQLLALFQAARISFDLEDCDKVLRVESGQVCPVQIINLMISAGYECQVLD